MPFITSLSEPSPPTTMMVLMPFLIFFIVKKYASFGFVVIILSKATFSFMSKGLIFFHFLIPFPLPEEGFIITNSGAFILLN